MKASCPARVRGLLGTVGALAAAAAPGLAQTQTQVLHAQEPRPGALFGNAVSMSGDLACIGAWLTDAGGGTTGNASVHRRVGETWFHEADLPRPFVPAYVLFGCDVAVSSSPAGEVAVVGAPLEYRDPEDGSSLWPGSAYVFRKVGQDWVLEQRLLPRPDADLFFFGFTVGAAENLIVVGSPNEPLVAPGSGAVHVFRHDPARPFGERWTLDSAPLCPPEVQTNQQFGGDVNVDVTNGVERFIAGAHDTGVAGLTAGAGTIYRNVGGTWQVEAGGQLVLPEEVDGDPSFTTTALDGHVALLGTGGRDVGVLTNAGAAWAYRFDGSEWRFEQKLVAADGAPDEGFGRELAVHGDLALVAAPWHDWDGVSYYGTGANHFFRFDGTEWREVTPKLVGAPGDGFVNPAILGSHALIGALGRDVGTEAGTAVDAGAAYAFELANSPAGIDVVVQPVDEESGAAPVTLTFTEILAPGTTSVVVSSSGPPPPNGYALGSPATTYEISTEAAFTGEIELCIDYAGVAYADEPALRLLHFVDGAWVEVPAVLDPEADRICGRVSSLSPFVVAERSAIDVLLDVKPGSDTNTIHLRLGGRLPFAILSSGDFEAATVDPGSVTLAGAPVARRANGSRMAELTDVNGDGRLDLLMKVETPALQVAEGDTRVFLLGSTFAGQAIQGQDGVRVVP